MVTLPFPEKCLRIALSGALPAGAWANIMYAKYSSGPPSVIDLNTFASDLATLWGTTFANLVYTGTNLKQVVVVDINSNTGVSGLWAGTAKPGAMSGAPTVASIAVAASWKIARRYRGGHPRTYIGGMPTSTLADTRLFTDVYTTSVKNNLSTWLAGVNTKTYASTGLIHQVNVSYWYTPVKGQPPQLRPVPQVDDILAVDCKHRIDTQRRRLGKETS